MDCFVGLAWDLRAANTHASNLKTLVTDTLSKISPSLITALNTANASRPTTDPLTTCPDRFAFQLLLSQPSFRSHLLSYFFSIYKPSYASTPTPRNRLIRPQRPRDLDQVAKQLLQARSEKLADCEPSTSYARWYESDFDNLLVCRLAKEWETAWTLKESEVESVLRRLLKFLAWVKADIKGDRWKESLVPDILGLRAEERDWTGILEMPTEVEEAGQGVGDGMHIDCDDLSGPDIFSGLAGVVGGQVGNIAGGDFTFGFSDLLRDDSDIFGPVTMPDLSTETIDSLLDEVGTGSATGSTRIDPQSPVLLASMGDIQPVPVTPGDQAETPTGNQDDPTASSKSSIDDLFNDDDLADDIEAGAQGEETTTAAIRTVAETTGEQNAVGRVSASGQRSVPKRDEVHVENLEQRDTSPEKEKSESVTARAAESKNDASHVDVQKDDGKTKKNTIGLKGAEQVSPVAQAQNIASLVVDEDVLQKDVNAAETETENNGDVEAAAIPPIEATRSHADQQSSADDTGAPQSPQAPEDGEDEGAVQDPSPTTNPNIEVEVVSQVEAKTAPKTQEPEPQSTLVAANEAQLDVQEERETQATSEAEDQVETGSHTQTSAEEEDQETPSTSPAGLGGSPSLTPPARVKQKLSVAVDKEEESEEENEDEGGDEDEKADDEEPDTVDDDDKSDGTASSQPTSPAKTASHRAPMGQKQSQTHPTTSQTTRSTFPASPFLTLNSSTDSTTSPKIQPVKHTKPLESTASTIAKPTNSPSPTAAKTPKTPTLSQRKKSETPTASSSEPAVRITSPADSASVQPSAPPKNRGPGRPRKADTDNTPTSSPAKKAEDVGGQETPPKRGPGRPRKNVGEPGPVVRKRGPKKVVREPSPEVEDGVDDDDDEDSEEEAVTVLKEGEEEDMSSLFVADFGKSEKRQTRSSTKKRNAEAAKLDEEEKAKAAAKAKPAKRLKRNPLVGALKKMVKK